MQDRKYLKDFIDGTGLKYGFVADKVGTSPSWLSQVFNGAPISRVLARAISNWVESEGGDISVDRLMGKQTGGADGL